jgi:hypothetical protein
MDIILKFKLIEHYLTCYGGTRNAYLLKPWRHPVLPLKSVELVEPRPHPENGYHAHTVLPTRDIGTRQCTANGMNTDLNMYSCKYKKQTICKSL